MLTRRSEYAQVHDQRGRMLTAVAELAAEKGYPALTASEIIARGRVSRATFYAEFQDREECFLTALSVIAAMAVTLGLWPRMSEYR